MSVVAVVPAAGRGERLGWGRPKALAPVGGRAMVARAVDGLLAGGADTVIVAAPPGGEDEMRAALGSRAATVVTGADDRVGSVAAGLALACESSDDVQVVLVHDAARCLCPPDVVRAVIAAVRTGRDAVVPATAVADTLKRVDADGRVLATVDRAGLAGVQTPQGFRPDVLREAHARAHADGIVATDDAGLVERLGVPVSTVPGDPRAFKVTTPLDLAMAEALVRV